MYLFVFKITPAQFFPHIFVPGSCFQAPSSSQVCRPQLLLLNKLIQTCLPCFPYLINLLTHMYISVYTYIYIYMNYMCVCVSILTPSHCPLTNVISISIISFIFIKSVWVKLFSIKRTSIKLASIMFSLDIRFISVRLISIKLPSFRFIHVKLTVYQSYLYIKLISYLHQTYLCQFASVKLILNLSLYQIYYLYIT